MSDLSPQTPTPVVPATTPVNTPVINQFAPQTPKVIDPPQTVGPKRGNKVLFGFLIVLLLVVGICGLVGFLGYQKALALKSQVDALQATGKEAYAALKAQNLVETDAKLTELKSELDGVNSEYKSFGFLGSMPFVSVYYRDAGHGLNAGFAGLHGAQTLVKTIEPYADVLGFKAQASGSAAVATEDRIAIILGTLDKVTPALDSVTKDLETVSQELSAIDQNRYPEEVRGIKLRETIGQAKTLTAGAADAIQQARPIIEILPSVAGQTTRKKYLVLFQNSGELRPTGGFMTGYAILNVDKGKVEAEASGDIYDLDAKFKNKPPIPAILKEFLTTESRFNLRDMNVSPDFKVSMDTFYQNYEKVPGQPTNLDGILAVDTHFLSSLVKVLGPVDVPGFGTFSAETDARCGCPQIIYALSEIVDRPTNFIRENRKGILGPMMKAILTKAYSAPKQMWPDLFSVAWADVEGKHFQAYFFDPKAQAAAEAVNVAGRVIPGPDKSDYLMIVDTNLAGAKSNFFVNQKIEDNVELPQNGVLQHTLTITYNNPFKPSNCNLEAGQLCLNGKLNDWVRFYLPPGAKMVSSRGFDENSVKESDDLGHHVVEGVFALQPLSIAKIELTYAIPYSDPRVYSIYMQRQAGTEDPKHTFTVNGVSQDVTLTKDQLFKFNF